MTFLPGNAGNQFQITCTNPAANRVITIPDPGASANLVLTQGAQVTSIVSLSINPHRQSLVQQPSLLEQHSPLRAIKL